MKVTSRKVERPVDDGAIVMWMLHGAHKTILLFVWTITRGYGLIGNLLRLAMQQWSSFLNEVLLEIMFIY